MPTNRTKRVRARQGLDHWKVDQLVTGQCLIAGVGYAQPIGSGCSFWTPDKWAQVHQAMRADWAAHGEDVMAWWRGEHDRFTDEYTSREKLREWIGRHGQTEPWAARKFGVPE